MQNLIKFSLPINGTKIQYLEQLKENYVVQEIDELYHSKILQHWLKNRGYTEQLEKVESLNPFMDEDDLQEELQEIFNISSNEVIDSSPIDVDDLDIDEIYKIAYPHIFEEYAILFKDILDNKSDSVHKLLPKVKTLLDNYLPLLSVDSTTFQVLMFQPKILLLMLSQPRGWSLFNLDPSIEHEKNIIKVFILLYESSQNLEGISLDEMDQHLLGFAEDQMSDNFDEKFAPLFKNMPLEEDFSPIGNGWDRLFDSGRYLIWVDNPDEVEIRSSTIDGQAQTLHQNHLYLVEGLEYKCLPSAYGSADIHIFKAG